MPLPRKARSNASEKIHLRSRLPETANPLTDVLEIHSDRSGAVGGTYGDNCADGIGEYECGGEGGTYGKGGTYKDGSG